MKNIGVLRSVVWLVLALPGMSILFRWAAQPEIYGYGHAIGDTGDWAVWLLIATLAATPLRGLFRHRGWTAWLIRYRRELGVASFAYAAGHTIIYITGKVDAGAIIAEAASPDMLAGWLALALFLPLAVTSNDMAVRALRRSWKKLHRLVYPAALLAFLHWVLATFDPKTAYVFIGGLGVLQIVRFWRRSRQRVT